ncbi:adenylate cyclase [Rhizobium sp. No.120]
MKFLLRTFGEIALLDGGEYQITFPKKALLIIAYLLTSDRKSVSRTNMARFLWGDGDLANSLTNLRKLVSRIKSRQSELNTEFLIFDDADIYLATGSLESDILPTHIDPSKAPAKSLARLSEALQSKFMERANCQTRTFIDWREGERRRHFAILKETLDAAVKLPISTDDVASIKELALLLFEAEPHDIATHRILLKAFDAEGGLEQLKRIFTQRKDLASSWPAILQASSHSSRSAIEPHSTAMSDQDTSPRTISRIPRLVLLPPVGGRPDDMVTMLASSLIEDITLCFSALHGLRVIAPYSAAQIGRQSGDQAALFERYDINYVLKTRLRGPKEDPTLFTQLISLPSREILWAERFSFGKPHLARFKRKISQEIARTSIAEAKHHELTRIYFEQNSAAYHRYLVGLQYLQRPTLTNLTRARKELKAALRQSAGFVPALSSLARTYSKEWLLTPRGNHQLLKSAEDLAKRAISVRNDLSDGYRELGIAKLLLGSIDNSLEALEIAETLSPHHADIIADHADTLVHFSRPGLALEKIQLAMDLNPINPDYYLWIAARANYALKQFQTALDYISRMIDPKQADGLAAASWAMLGNQDEARALVRRVLESNPAFDIDEWLSLVAVKEQWHKDLYREGLKKAGF